MADSLKEIAKIKRAEVELEDHGILTLTIEFDGGGWGQCAPQHFLKSEGGPAWIEAWLKAVSVRKVSDLVGKTVFVLYKEPYGAIVGIENLPTERGSTLMFESFWKEYKDE